MSKSSSDDTAYETDDLVIETVSYRCPICENETNGEYHEDCFTQCDNCEFYYKSSTVRKLKNKAHTRYSYYLCKQCYNEDELLELKEPSDE